MCCKKCLDVRVFVFLLPKLNVFPVFYCPILVSLCDLWPLRWQDWHPVWSSAALSPSALRYHVLLLFFVTVAFVSSRTSLGILLWPLSLTRHFHSENCGWLDIFSFRTIPCKLDRCWCIKIPVDRQFLKYSNEPVWHQLPWFYGFAKILQYYNFNNSNIDHKDISRIMSQPNALSIVLNNYSTMYVGVLE